MVHIVCRVTHRGVLTTFRLKTILNEFLFVILLKHVDQYGQSGSSNTFVYYTLLEVGITSLVLPWVKAMKIIEKAH